MSVIFLLPVLAGIVLFIAAETALLRHVARREQQRDGVKLTCAEKLALVDLNHNADRPGLNPAAGAGEAIAEAKMRGAR